jgi:hypothetical protein
MDPRSPAARSRLRPRGARALLVSFTAALLLLPTPGSAAAPEDDTSYAPGGSATLARDLAFDTCTAPTLASMRAWRASPYDTVNIYFGGFNRACQQPELTRRWVRKVDRLGFGLLPTYLSAQPYCQMGNKPVTYTRRSAAAKGRNDARDAARQAQGLGLERGSALYADVEHFDAANRDCRRAVQRYLTAWTRTLHNKGFLAGAYLHLYSGLPAARDMYRSARSARVDAVWAARWDLKPTLRNWDGIPNRMWSQNQRVKQYRGGHVERHGGVSINIDSNAIAAPVATVARVGRTTADLRVRRQPTTQARSTRSISDGQRVAATCRVSGERVAGSRTWLRLRAGGYVSRPYVKRLGPGGVPACRLGYQVSARGGLAVRTGPTTDSRAVGSLPRGAMAWVRCQTRVDGEIWDRIGRRQWVSDAYVETGRRGFAPSAPRCISG